MHLDCFQPFCPRETNFVTSSLSSRTSSPFWKWIFSKRNKFGRPIGSKFIIFGLDPFPEGRQTILTELSPLKVNPFPLSEKWNNFITWLQQLFCWLAHYPHLTCNHPCMFIFKETKFIPDCKNYHFSSCLSIFFRLEALKKKGLLTLVLLNVEIYCLCKQCRSRLVGFFRSQLIWICTVCHSLWEFIWVVWI